MSSRNYYIICVLLFAVYFLNGILAIPKLSITADESDHLSYGIRMLKGQPSKVLPFDDASTMPVSALNAIPRGVEQVLHPGLKKTDWGQSDVFSGRYISLILTALIGLFILNIARTLYGRNAGLFSLFLFVVCPNLNGHGILVATDTFSALFTLSSAWYFRKMILDMRWRNVAMFAIHLGLAQLVKQSLTHLFIIYTLLFIFFLAKGFIKEKPGAILARVGFTIIIVLVVLNAGFLFSGTGTTLNNYHFTSQFFQGFQRQMNWMGNIPLPLPEPYLSGLDLTKHIDEIGPGYPESSANAYLLGQMRVGEGFWYYYIVVFFFKTPIPVLLLSIILLFQLLKDRKRFIQNEFIFLFIILYFFIFFSFFYKSQVGIRHLLMVFPLLYVLLGKTTFLLEKRQTLFISLGLYSVFTFWNYYPNLIAYTNEFLLPKRNAYRILADSNIDYRQSNFFLKSYLNKNPDVKIADSIPHAGRQLMGINEYLDLDNSHRYTWLRTFKPIAQVAHSYLLFEISEDDIKAMKRE